MHRIQEKPRNHWEVDHWLIRFRVIEAGGPWFMYALLTLESKLIHTFECNNA